MYLNNLFYGPIVWFTAFHRFVFKTASKAPGSCCTFNHFSIKQKRDKHTHTPTNPTKEHTHTKHVAYVLCVALKTS